MDDLIILLIISILLGYILLERAKYRYIKYIGISPDISLNISGYFNHIKPPLLSRKSELLPKYVKSEKVDRALWRIVEYVIRDFIDWWFIPNVSSNNEMQNDVRDMLDFAFAKLADTVSDVNWAYFVSKCVITNFKNLLRRLRKCEQDLLRNDPTFRKDNSEIRLKKLRIEILKSFKLHCVATGAVTPTNYLRNVSACLCSQLLRERDYNSDVVRTLIREVLTCNILVPCLSFVHPYYINSGIVSAFQSVMKEEEKDHDNKKLNNNNNNNEINNNGEDINDEDGEFNVGHTIPNDINDIEIEGDDNNRRDSLTMKINAWNVEREKRRSEQSNPRKFHNLISESTLSFADDHETKEAGVITNTQAPTKWSIKIVQAITKQKPKAHVVYQLKVQNGVYSWIVEKRYSAFVELHEKFKKKVKSFDAHLPKKQVFGNLDAKFVNERKNALQKYLDEVVMHRKIVEHENFRLFLMPGMDTPLVPIQTKDKASKSVDSRPVAKYSSADLLNNKPRPRNLTTVSNISETEMGDLDDNDNNNTNKISRRKKMKNVLKDLVGKLKKKDRKDSHESHHSITSYETSTSQTSLNNNNLNEEGETNNSDEEGRDNNNNNEQQQKDEEEEEEEIQINNEIQQEQSSISPIITSSLSDNNILHHRKNSVSQPSSPRKDNLSNFKSQSPNITSNVNNEIEPLTLDAKNREFLIASLKNTPWSINNNNNNNNENVNNNKKVHHRRASLWQQNRMITQPLYELIDEVFALEERNIISRQVTRVVTQMLEWILDRTIRIWFSNQVDSVTNEQSVVDIINYVADTVWPDGELFKPGDWPPQEEMDHWRDQAKECLSNCMPFSLQALLGGKTCEKGANRLYEFCQIEPLILHLAYSSLDALVLELFPILKDDETSSNNQQ